MAKVPLYNIVLLIFLLSFILLECKSDKKNTKKDKKDKKAKKEKKQKKPKKVDKEDNIDIIKSTLDWAKNNNIYINDKIVLNRKTHRDKHFYFSADRRLLNNTLLFKVPYSMMISQFSLNEIYKNSKHKKFQDLWDRTTKLTSEYVKYFSTKQLLYMSIILENAFRTKKGPIYKKYKEYLRIYDYIDMDIYPIFYSLEEKYFLSVSNFGSQLNRATQSLNEEYYITDKELNLNIPFQEEFYKTRVISLVSSIDFRNENLNYTNGFNDTVIAPFLDCFSKVASDDKANARYEIKGIKNETTNLIDYYLEIYSNDEILLGGEINLKWRPFPNPELLLYFGFIEENNPFTTRYYIDFINNKFKKDLNISENENLISGPKNMYDLTTEFFEPFVIEEYRNISKKIEKYRNMDEGLYQLMLDNLKYYLDLYDNPLSDGNINMYINGNEKIKDIKDIMHSEREIIERRIKRLEKNIKDIKGKKSQKVEEKKTESNSESNKQDL